MLFLGLVAMAILLHRGLLVDDSNTTSKEEAAASVEEALASFVPGGVELTQTQNGPARQTENVLSRTEPGEAGPFGEKSLYLRSRMLTLQPGLNLKAPPVGREDKAVREFVFQLFEDVELIGLVSRLERHADDRVVYSGSLTNVEGGDFILAYHKGEVAATFSTPTLGVFQLRPLGGGLHVARELDSAELPTCETQPSLTISVPTPMEVIRAKTDLLAEIAASHPATDGLFYGGEGQQGGNAAGLDFTVIDLLLVYTENAANAAGGDNAILAVIDMAVARANSAFINSEVGLRLRTVRSEKVSYAEINPDQSLQDLTQGNGALANVPAWRNESGADLVAMVFNGGGGRAWLYSGRSEAGFSVNGYDALEGTLTHEIGHNLGCQHDRENAGSVTTLYPFGYGWRFTPPNGQELRTVMAYTPGQAIPYFSNPEVTYMGSATGIRVGDPQESNNAEAIRRTMATVTGFRSPSGNSPPRVSLRNPTWHDSLKALDPVNISATASDDDGQVTAVRFYRLMSDRDFYLSGRQSFQIGSTTTEPYSFAESRAPAGFWTYAAVAMDDEGALGIDTVSVSIAPHYRQTTHFLPPGTTRVNIDGLNEAGRVVGFLHAGNTNSTTTQAAYWEEGGMVSLAALTGDTGAQALGVDQSGIVYGRSISAAGVRRAVRWQFSTTPTDISQIIDGFTADTALGADELGRIYLASGNDCRRFDNPGATTTGPNERWHKVSNTGLFAAGIDFANNAWRALRWNNGGTRLAPLPGFSSSWGRAANRHGAIVGFSSPASSSWDSASTRLTFWPAGSTTPMDLGTWGTGGGLTHAINDWNEIVGYARTADGSAKAVLWKGSGDLLTLDDLTLTSAGTKRDALVINNRGQIAGTGFIGQEQFIYFLDPLRTLDNRYWLANHFHPAELDNPNLISENANPAGDGIPNLVKRSLGLNPRVPVGNADLAKLPSGEIGSDGHFHFRFRRARLAGDIIYRAEAARELDAANWDESLLEVINVTPLDQDYEEVHVRTVFMPSAEQRGFVRLRLTR